MYTQAHSLTHTHHIFISQSLLDYDSTSSFIRLFVAVLQDGWEDARGYENSCDESPRHPKIIRSCSASAAAKTATTEVAATM